MADIDSNSSDGSSLLGDAGKALKGVGEDVTRLAGSAVKNFFGGLTGSAKGGSTDPMLTDPNYTVIITQEGKNPITVVGSAPKNFNIQQQANFSAPFAAGLSGILGSTGSDVLAATNGTRLIGHSMTMQMWQGKGSELDFQISFDLRTWSDPYLDVVAPLQKLLSMTMPGLTDQGFLTSPGPLLDPAKAGKLFAAPIVNTFGKIGSNISSALKGDGTLADKFGAAITGAATGFIGNALPNGMLNGPAVTQNQCTASNPTGASGSTGLFGTAAFNAEMTNKINIVIGNWFNLKNIVITDVQYDLHSQMPDGSTGSIGAATVTISFRPVFMLVAQDIQDILKKASSSSAPSGMLSMVSKLLK